MFTGIIQAIGTLRQIDARGGDCRITIDTGTLPMADTTLGDSIAVNGVCLTAVALDGPRFSADVSRETLSRTTLGQAAIGDPVNLELALLPTTRLGGHLVSGHVDGLGTVTERRHEGRSWRFTIEALPWRQQPSEARTKATRSTSKLISSRVTLSDFYWGIEPQKQVLVLPCSSLTTPGLPRHEQHG